MSDYQDQALKKCALKEFTPRSKDTTLSTATTCGSYGICSRLSIIRTAKI